MIRTRKRDDDSLHNNSTNSDATSLAALDASSMSATGSRSSLTFASSQKNETYSKRNHTNQHHHQIQPHRPRKRQRKSLTDALQSISLDRDGGVPAQILELRPAGKHPRFSFRKSSVVFAGEGIVGAGGAAAAKTSSSTTTTNATSAGATGSLHTDNSHKDLNLQQQMDRRMSQLRGHGNHHRGEEGKRDGDIYFDTDDYDDNSQLTSSTGDNETGRDEGMDDDSDDDDDDDDGEGSQGKKEFLMTDLEKAQRKVMLALVFGKNHREARKQQSVKLSSSTRGVVPAPPTRLTPTGATGSLSPPPMAVIATTARTPAASTLAIATATKTTKTATATATAPSVPPNQDDKEDDYKDPADRKIEELLRRSLKNLREGSHPLQLPKSGARSGATTGDALFTTTPWKTQDDMAIDPEIYSHRPRTAPIVSMLPVPEGQRRNPNQKAKGVVLTVASTGTTTAAPSSKHFGANPLNPQAQQGHDWMRRRSNSLPDGLDTVASISVSMTETTDMEMDG